MKNRDRALHAFLASVLLSCGGHAAAPHPDSEKPDEIAEPPIKLALALSPKDQAKVQRLQAKVTDVATLTASQILARHPVANHPLGYDPTKAKHLDIITQSALKPSAEDLAVLGTQGFVISRQKTYPSFAYGYAAIYAADLPLFISADSILDAVHRSYDKLLSSFEQNLLMADLQALLSHLRTNLSQSPVATPKVRADLDVYLAVPLAMLTGEPALPVAGGSAEDIQRLVHAAVKGEGFQETKLFGVKRLIDFSQFKPRGHYTDSMALSRYFRAMMWLGRVEFRLIETQNDGSQAFYRSQVDSMLVLAELLGPEGRTLWMRIEGVIRKFVGLSDYMTVEEVATFLSNLGVTSLAEAVRVEDVTMAHAILDGGFGAQQIASQLAINGGTVPTLPLNRSFLLFGQRYVVDSHVFSNLVYDRVGKGTILRMMPNPLDVAYAALGNDHALSLLVDELTRYPYAPDLEAMRILVDEHSADYWESTLYTGWLSALRALSPSIGQNAESGLPAIASTDGWKRRMINTQLASWSELRHDTILYAKQSYTTGALCEFPDAYVDPYPELFRRLEKFSLQGAALADMADAAQKTDFANRVRGYFNTLATVTGMLATMADQQRRGIPFTTAQMAFINETVRVQAMCGGAYTTGWYSQLFFAGNAAEEDPIIADVHTQFTDETGTPVGRILHVGTSNPRLMLVTADTCSGPKAYAGLAFAYHETITQDFQRLSDPEWKASLKASPPSDVSWLEPVLGPVSTASR